MSYTPQPGTTAFRALAYLQTLPPGAELMTSALAEAIGVAPVNLVPCLDAALKHGMVFRRQRDNHVRSPMWWSLTDHGARPKQDIRKPAVPAANGHAELHVPTFKEPEGAAAIAGRPARAKETAHRGAVRALGKPQPSEDSGAGDDAKPAVGAAAPEGFRCALWSNGVLQIERQTVGGAAELVLLSRDETRELVHYLDRMREAA